VSEQDESDFGGRGDEPGAWPEPFTPEWRERMQRAQDDLSRVMIALETCWTGPIREPEV